MSLLCEEEDVEELEDCFIIRSVLIGAKWRVFVFFTSEWENIDGEYEEAMSGIIQRLLERLGYRLAVLPDHRVVDEGGEPIGVWFDVNSAEKAASYGIIWRPIIVFASCFAQHDADEVVVVLVDS